MQNRLTKLREKMMQKGIDTALIVKPENRRYLSGFTGSSGYLIITQQEAVLITDSRYTQQAGEQTKFKVIEHKANILDTLKDELEKFKSSKIGFEENFLTLKEYNQILEKLKIDLVPLEGSVEELRMIKDETEISSIRKAVELGDKTFSYILGLVKPGITEKELAVEMEYYLKKSGAEGLAFDTIVAAGSRTSLPHAEPGENKIQYGDFLLFDFGCKVNGYCSDMSRTVFVGKADDEQRKVYSIVLESQKRALDFAMAGKKGSEVDKVARDYITEKGYGEKFGHGLGHSVGLYIHEEPRLSATYDKELHSNMVVTVEPGIYIEGFGGVRIEDMVIIKENSAENLMKSPKELIII